MRLSDKRYEEIKMDIAVTFEDYNVNGLPIDVFDLAKKMGVIVVYASQIIKKNKWKINEFMLFSYPPSYLYYSKEKQKFFVYIDDVGTNKSRQRFSMAHELMHIILGHTEQNERNEAEADFGAQYMLAPTSLILLAPDHWLLEETDFIKFVFDVSEPVAEITIRYNHNRLYYISLEEKPYEEIINNQLGTAFNDIISPKLKRA